MILVSSMEVAWEAMLENLLIAAWAISVIRFFKTYTGLIFQLWLLGQRR